MGESAGFAAARVRRSATPSTLRRREGRQNSADSWFLRGHESVCRSL